MIDFSILFLGKFKSNKMQSDLQYVIIKKVRGQFEWQELGNRTVGEKCVAMKVL